MARWLRYQTAATVPMGAFLSSTDGYTPSTALTPTIYLIKAGTTAGTTIASADSIYYDGRGIYMVPLSTVDSGSLGLMRAAYASTGNVLPIWEDFLVVPQTVYDALVAGTSYLGVDVQQWLAVAVAAGAGNRPAVDVLAIGGSTSTPAIFNANIGYLDVSVLSRLATSAYTAPPGASTIADAVWDELLSGHGTTLSAGEYLSRGDVVLSSRAATTDWTAARAAKIDNLDLAVSSRAATTDYTAARALLLDNLDAAISSRLALASYTAPPSASTIADAVWDELLAGHATTLSAGNYLAQLDAAITSRLASASYMAPPSASTIADAVWDELLAGHATTLSAGAYLAASGSPPSASTIADAVWDELLSGHATTLSAGAYLSAAGAAADPLLNPVPGSYAGGTAGYALGRIGSADITASVPVATDGTLNLMQGDDYLTTDGRELSISTTSGTGWPGSLTGSTVGLFIDGSSFVGTIVSSSLPHEVTFDLASSETAAFDQGLYGYRVTAVLSNGSEWTIQQGKAKITKRVV